MTWHYNGEPFTQTPEQYQGFVYLIENIATEKLYVGKKNFWRVEKKPPLKGYKRRRLIRQETDWHNYYGSNTKLLEDIEVYGPESAVRTILYLCANKNQMSYFETREQFNRNVLFDSTYYNDYIGCRITSRGLGSDLDI
jgi:hypothetical protein